MSHLANIFWRSLTGSHAHLGEGTDRIKRYARGFPAMIGYADPANPDFASLIPFCNAGERFYCSEWRGSEPAGWTIEVDTSMCAMLWQGTLPAPDPSLQIARLGMEHVPQMLEIAAVTRPGPFPERPMEMGEWYGVLEGDRVVAMAAGPRPDALPARRIRERARTLALRTHGLRRGAGGADACVPCSPPHGQRAARGLNCLRFNLRGLQ